MLTFFRLRGKALAASSPAGYEVRCAWLYLYLYYSLFTLRRLPHVRHCPYEVVDERLAHGTVV